MPSSRRRTATRLLVAAVALAGVALLIWSKLRLVTGLPRTAYAEPGARAPAGQDRRESRARPEPGAPRPRASADQVAPD